MSTAPVVQLPPMTAEQAAACLELLNRIVTAIWETHEEGLVEIAAREAAIEPPEPEAWEDASDVPW